MKDLKKEEMIFARPETMPQIPGKLSWKAKIFGKQVIDQYLWNYYERESAGRIPFYLPYIYMKECFDHLRRYGSIPKRQIGMVLIDDGDSRIDYFLSIFMEELNELTIVTERKEYFEGLQERAFQELGLLIDLWYPWEEKNLRGNFVWDFSKKLQPADCYPQESVCFLPHKKEQKVKKILKDGLGLTIFTLSGVESMQKSISPALAESLLVPSGFPFRRTRCEELRSWCKSRKLALKIRAQSLENP